MMANRFIGDGSGLTNINAIGDNLGNHTATQALNMSGQQIINVSSLTVAGALGIASSRLYMNPNVVISSANAANYGGVYVSTHMYIAGKYYGDGSALSGISGDNLGNHTAMQALNMADMQIQNVSSITVTGKGTSGYSLSLSSGINMPAGTVTAGLFSGNGASLNGLNASSLASGTVADGRLSSNVDLLNANQTIAGVKTFTSSVTVTGKGASGYSLNLSSGINMPGGTVNGGLFIGSGSLLADLNASSLVSGTISDVRLSSNVDLLGANQTVSGIKTFTSSMTVVGSAVISSTLTVQSIMPDNFVGAVMYFARSSCPNGFLEAKGNPAVSRTTYANLFSAIGTTFGTGDGSTTFNLPELRGEFIRGVDDGRGVDNYRVLGSTQAFAVEAHFHFPNFSVGGSGSGPFYSASSAGGYATNPQSTTYGTNETRPRNVALMACIKY